MTPMVFQQFTNNDDKNDAADMNVRWEYLITMFSSKEKTNWMLIFLMKVGGKKKTECRSVFVWNTAVRRSRELGQHQQKQ